MDKKKILLYCAVFFLGNQISFSQDHETVQDTTKNNHLEEVIVTSSRTNSRIENTPTRVEVLGVEEMQEENGVKPGNIMSLLGDVAGIQMQQVSATSGNTTARIQGLNGRYTQILKDGMPLFGGATGAFSIMQVPPLDLKQIEIIKGSASTLYGGDAIGGIINLVSKNPDFKRDLSLTVNHSSLNETNLNGYFAKQNQKVGFTFFAGQTLQKGKDINKDGLTDVAQVSSTLIHPKWLFYFNPNSTLTLNYSGVFDRRRGGDNRYFNSYDSLLYHVDTHMIRNTIDGKWVYQLTENSNLNIKASTSMLHQKIGTNSYDFNSNQTIFYSEASYFYKTAKMSWVTGINLNGELLHILPTNITLGDYHYSTFGSFIQNTFKLTTAFTIESGFRMDFHSKFGNFPLPRISLLYKINSDLTARLNGGLGYKIPNVLNYVDIENDLNKLPTSFKLDAERSEGVNADINYKKRFGEDFEITLNQSFFYTKIKNPLIDTSLDVNVITLENAQSGLNTKGFQTYIRTDFEPFEFYLGYVFTEVNKEYDNLHKNLVVTPKHNLSGTLFFEPSKSWRFGIESSYIAKQVDQNYVPVANYVLAATMIQYNYKNMSFVLNGENMLNVNQSKFESLYQGTISTPTFNKLWAPIDGRVINLSVKVCL